MAVVQCKDVGNARRDVLQLSAQNHHAHILSSQQLLDDVAHGGLSRGVQAIQWVPSLRQAHLSTVLRNLSRGPTTPVHGRWSHEDAQVLGRIGDREPSQSRVEFRKEGADIEEALWKFFIEARGFPWQDSMQL